MHRLFPLVLLVACVGAETAPPGALVDPPAEAPPELAITGGWSDADPGSEGIAAAAKRAEELLRARTGDATLAVTGVTSARTQVVAGTNYGLVLDLTGKDGPKTGIAVVLYQDLQDAWQLTSVEGL